MICMYRERWGKECLSIPPHLLQNTGLQVSATSPQSPFRLSPALSLALSGFQQHSLLWEQHSEQRTPSLQRIRSQSSDSNGPQVCARTITSNLRGPHTPVWHFSHDEAHNPCFTDLATSLQSSASHFQMNTRFLPGLSQ